MSENIFDWVRDTFTTPNMQTSPHVMDQGTRVVDPEEEAAKHQLLSNPSLLGGPQPLVPPVQSSPHGDGTMAVDPHGNPGGTKYVHGSIMPDINMPELPQMYSPELTATPYEGYDGDYELQSDPSLQNTGPLPLPPAMLEEEAVDENGVPMPPEAYAAQPDGSIPVDENGIPLVDENGVPTVPLDTDPTNRPEGHPNAYAAQPNGTVKPAGEGQELEKDVPLSGMTDPVEETDPDITPEEAAVTKAALEDAEPVNGVTGADAAKVAAEDPKGFKKAMSWFEENLGLTGKDLTRMAIFYAGSRIAGYDHSGSMSWAFETGMKMTMAREVMIQGLTKDGKYTAESIEEFKKTNDRSKLKLYGGTNPVKTDFTSIKIGKDGKTYYKRQDKTGNQWYESKDGKMSDGVGLKDPSDQQSRIEIVNEAAPTATKIVSSVIERQFSDKDEDSGVVKGLNIDPEVAGPAAVEILLDMHPDLNHSDELNSAMYTKVVQNAIEMAGRDAKAGKTVGGIAPYVVAQMQYYKNDGTDNGWKQALMRKGEKLKVEEWFDVRNGVMNGFKDHPKYQDALAAKGEAGLTDFIFGQMYKTFKESSTDDQQKDPDAFFRWLQNNM